MKTAPNHNTLSFIRSSGFIDGYKASNFDSNSSVIKFHEEELSELLKLLKDNLSHTNQGEGLDLLLVSLTKSDEKLVSSTHNFKEAESSYIQSFSAFSSFLDTLTELKFPISPYSSLIIKKILQHYKILSEKTMLEVLTDKIIITESTFLIGK